MTKVSVIVPFYNVENYIRKCLTSLINQTLQEIEILIVNDGSKDGSKEIVNEFIQKHPDKMKYFEKENGGLSDARNYAIPYATGEYIAFLDSDDYIEPTMYEKMYKKAVEEKADMVECDFVWEYPEKSIISSTDTYEGKKQMLLNARVVAWNKLIKRQLLQETKVIFPKGYRYEDVEFFYQLLPFIEKVAFVKEPFIHYVQREDSISNTQNERTIELLDVLDHVITYYKERDLYEEYQEELEYIYARYIFCSSLFRMVMISDKKVKKDILKRAWNRLQIQFPNWKKNRYLKNKNLKNTYMRHINKITYPIFCFLGSKKIVRKQIQNKFW